MKGRKKKKNKLGTEDQNPLLDALPGLQSLLVSKNKKASKDPKLKLRGILKMKKRLKQQ